MYGTLVGPDLRVCEVVVECVLTGTCVGNAVRGHVGILQAACGLIRICYKSNSGCHHWNSNCVCA